MPSTDLPHPLNGGTRAAPFELGWLVTDSRSSFRTRPPIGSAWPRGRRNPEDAHRTASDYSPPDGWRRVDVTQADHDFRSRAVSTRRGLDARARDRDGCTRRRWHCCPQPRDAARHLHPERDFALPRSSASRSAADRANVRSEEHTSELQSPCNLVCRLLLEKKKIKNIAIVI